MIGEMPWGVLIGNLTSTTIGGIAVLSILAVKLAMLGHLQVLTE